MLPHAGMDAVVGDLNTLMAGAVLGGGIAACIGSATKPSPPTGKM